MNGKLRQYLTLLLLSVFIMGAFCPSVMLASENLDQNSPAGNAEDTDSQIDENGQNEQTAEPATDDPAAPADNSAEEPAEPTEPTEPTEPAEPEKTLEQLRDELMAILGESEETQTILAEINRLIALGDPNGTLRTYLEGSIRLHQMQYEMEQLQSQLGQLAASDAGLAAIDDAAAAIGVVDDLLLRVETDISEAAARLMENAGYDGTGELAEMASAALAYVDGTETGRNLAVILLMTDLQNSGLLTDTGLVTASDEIRASLSQLAAAGATLSSAQRARLESESQAITGRANNAEALSPDWLVTAGNSLQLTAPVFTYNGSIMLSLADAAAFAGGQVIEMTDNDAVVIQAPGMVLEMVKGSSDAYLNDKLLKMPASVLSFDGVCYVPLDTVLSGCGMTRMTIDNYHLIYEVRQG